jgi:hypothetical protein
VWPRPTPRPRRRPAPPPTAERRAAHAFIEPGAGARLPGRGARPRANRSPSPAALICLSPWQPRAQLSISCGKQLWEGVGMGRWREEWARPPGGHRGGLQGRRAGSGCRSRQQTLASGDLRSVTRWLEGPREQRGAALRELLQCLCPHRSPGQPCPAASSLFLAQLAQLAWSRVPHREGGGAQRGDLRAS